jgi:hypothetical protein
LELGLCVRLASFVSETSPRRVRRFSCWGVAARARRDLFLPRLNALGWVPRERVQVLFLG